MDRNNYRSGFSTFNLHVALRKESVDRNPGTAGGDCYGFGVALRKESVDRNHQGRLQGNPAGTSLSARRAWIEIGDKIVYSDDIVSLSARRAWIEMLAPALRGEIAAVALRKEAWIEIGLALCQELIHAVALRKESVDRNYGYGRLQRPRLCRSPQGERG